MTIVNKLTRGLNLWGRGGSIDMMPGEALDAQDVLWRADGAFYKHWGWRRINATALTDRIIAHKGFTYKGKNAVNAAPWTVRPGNFGIADDGADYTRRQAFYSTGIIITETELRFWNPATETFDLPQQVYAGPTWIPTGAAIDLDPKPTIVIFQNNAYIFGFMDVNLRYDPVDRILYQVGWDLVPAMGAATATPAGGAGDMQVGAVYQYRVSFLDVYTGEESELSAAIQATPTAANSAQINLANLNGGVGYGGNRYFNDALATAGDDVGMVVYRTDPNGETFYFLTTLDPGTFAYNDVNNATDKSIRAIVRDYEDMPRLNFATEFRSSLYGVSWDNNWARVYFNDYRTTKSYWSRYDVRNYRELPLQDGEVLTCIQKTNESLIIFSNLSAYEMHAVPSKATGRIDLTLRPMEWTVGCVGPKASEYVDNWVYWLSDRGPYRWRRGMAPQHIGKNLLPLFIDPTTGLCQLNAGMRLEAETLYDPKADVVRFLFGCGSTTTLNRHLMYWTKSDEYNGSPYNGWAFASPHAQAMDFTNVYEPLVGGVPIDPFDELNQFQFSIGGYLYEYDPVLRRGGLPPGQPARGVAQAGSGVNLIVTTGGLYLNGDDMAGLRLEVVHTDGTIDVTTVASNTAVNIVPTDPLSADPTGATWYVGGIPAWWRSWVDHAGDPAAHKDITDLYIGFNLEDPTGQALLDIEVVVGHDWPGDNPGSRVRSTALNKHRDSVMIAMVGRFLTYELANTRPDEVFTVTYIDPDLMILGARRQAGG